MTTIVQVEYSSSLLETREDILQSLGHPVVSVLGSRAARNLDLSHGSVGLVLIGHGAPWEERCNLVAHFRETLPGVPIVAFPIAGEIRISAEPITIAQQTIPLGG